MSRFVARRGFAAGVPPAVAVAAVLILAVVAGTGRGAAAVGAEHTVSYSPPVIALIIDPFRPPSSPYGPGNRGIDYATTPGTPVRAAADGRVTFAGPVAGVRYVTVLHADGIRTSYGFLAEITVDMDQLVRRGDVVGRAGARLHVGARRGAAYLDPASLWGGGGRAVLVPLDGAGGAAEDRGLGGRAGIRTRPRSPGPRLHRPHRLHRRAAPGARAGRPSRGAPVPRGVLPA